MTMCAGMLSIKQMHGATAAVNDATISAKRH